MSDVVHKTRLNYLKSVHTPSYDGDWLINPVLPQCEIKYWRMYHGALKEMTLLQKKAVDDKAAAQMQEIQTAIETAIDNIGG
jgi:hypothetical protein